MSKYFNYFPKTAYYLEENVVSADVVTNITARFGFEQSFKIHFKMNSKDITKDIFKQLERDLKINQIIN